MLYSYIYYIEKSEKMLEFKNVYKSYVANKNVIDNLNMTIKDGEIFGFLGPNGAGKTTTIKMLTGILKPTEGEILIENKNIENEPIEAKKNLGYVPDSPDIFLNLTGYEYLNFISDVYNISKKDRKNKIEKISDEFEMREFLHDKIFSYSHGMRQKIILIGVLLHEPKNWILDEPMTGLDPKASHILKEKMREHASKGNTVFFSTHILEIAEKICDRIAIINSGKIVTLGSVNEIKEKFNADKSLENIFLEITENEENN